MIYELTQNVTVDISYKILPPQLLFMTDKIKPADADPPDVTIASLETRTSGVIYFIWNFLTMTAGLIVVLSLPVLILLIIVLYKLYRTCYPGAPQTIRIHISNGPDIFNRKSTFFVKNDTPQQPAISPTTPGQEDTNVVTVGRERPSAGHQCVSRHNSSNNGDNTSCRSSDNSLYGCIIHHKEDSDDQDRDLNYKSQVTCTVSDNSGCSFQSVPPVPQNVPGTSKGCQESFWRDSAKSLEDHIYEEVDDYFLQAGVYTAGADDNDDDEGMNWATNMGLTVARPPARMDRLSIFPRKSWC